MIGREVPGAAKYGIAVRFTAASKRHRLRRPTRRARPRRHPPTQQPKSVAMVLDQIFHLRGSGLSLPVPQHFLKEASCAILLLFAVFGVAHR